MNCVNKNFEKEIKSILDSQNNKTLMEERIKGLINHKIFIYGAGNAGSMTFKLLLSSNIDVDAFLDLRGGQGKKLFERPVYKAEGNTIPKSIMAESIVVIALICGNDEFNDIKNRLTSMGFKYIYYFHEIYNLLMTNNLISKNSTTSSISDNMTFYLSDVKDKIFQSSILFEDEESRSIYRNFITAIVRANSDYFSLPSPDAQYFPSDIPFNKGYSRFIDCGAFDGDTAAALVKYKGMVDAIALFEPENDNFQKLCGSIRCNRTAKTQILFPCGVWEKSETLRFNSGIQSSSNISLGGDVFIQCVALDDVLADFAPTFIKMDIEGAEFNALLGAKNIIKSYRPDLAISVYHLVEHMWSIPLLINSFNLGYKFYLRSYHMYGMETILYAVCNS